MKVHKDLVKLILLLIGLVAIIFGIHQLGKLEDRQGKYQHPITRPGASW